MTRVEFFFNVEDKLIKTAELCERAVGKSRELMIFTQNDEMNIALQAVLWRQSSTSFLASIRPSQAMNMYSSIVVTDRGDKLEKDDILINLQTEYPPFFSRFRYVAELVSNDEADKVAARLKFKFYRDRGYEIKSTDVGKRE